MSEDQKFKPLRSTRPPTSILSESFRYRNSAETDIRATFAKYQTKATVTSIKRKATP